MNYSKHTLLLSVTALSAMAILVGLVGMFIGIPNTNLLVNGAAGLYLLTGVYLLLINGKYLYTKYFKIQGIAISLWIIGAMLKIMHWPFSFYFLLAGNIFFVMNYLIYCLRQNHFHWIYIFKILFIATFIFGRFFKTLHWPYGQAISVLSLSILMFLLLNYYRSRKI